MLQSTEFRIGLNLRATATKLRSVARKAGKARGVLAVAFAAAAFTLPVVAVARSITWFGINRDFGKLVLYLDPASITREGDTGKAWLLFDLLAPQATPDGINEYQSLKELVTVRCADRSYARIKAIKYSGLHASGKVVDAYAWPPSKWKFEREVPFTNSQAVVDSVCPSVAVPSKG